MSSEREIIRPPLRTEATKLSARLEAQLTIRGVWQGRTLTVCRSAHMQRRRWSGHYPAIVLARPRLERCSARGPVLGCRLRQEKQGLRMPVSNPKSSGVPSCSERPANLPFCSAPVYMPRCSKALTVRAYASLRRSSCDAATEHPGEGCDPGMPLRVVRAVRWGCGQGDVTS